MEYRIVLQSEKGGIAWGWLLAFVILAAVIGATVLWLPKFKAPEPQRTVVRSKIPAMPAPAAAIDAAAIPAAPQPVAQEMISGSQAPPALPVPGLTASPSGQNETQKSSGAMDLTPHQSDTAPAAEGPGGEPSSSTDIAPAAPAKNAPAPPVPVMNMAKLPAPIADKGMKSPSVPAAVSAKAQEKPVKTVQKDTATAPTTESTPFFVQLGAYRTKANATGLMADLEKQGYAPFLVERTDARKHSLYLVRCGGYGTREEAVRAVNLFKSKEKLNAIVTASGSR